LLLSLTHRLPGVQKKNKPRSYSKRPESYETLSGVRITQPRFDMQELNKMSLTTKGK